ncbi:winged helix-turn-helix transcriptional regulator [Pseudonocardia lacus]|uniref:winged helix-turn-helix transcriptional regulator n=1 Tax=Pseudonocardia lacus TaxID=2835865 RepID=UPI001BDCD3CB|nr:helix-turn-helix domain-containing protein [Pseudonocardia lacus]
MDWSKIDSQRCSVARAASVVGDAWTVVVLRDLFNGIRRFDDLTAHLGIARNVLTRRLATLVDEGIVVRVPYREPGSRERHEYRLTQAGRDLRPIILAMLAWGDVHRSDGFGPPMRVEHAECGAGVHIELRCDDGHLLTPTTRLRAVPGPGARVAAD